MAPVPIVQVVGEQARNRWQLAREAQQQGRHDPLQPQQAAQAKLFEPPWPGAMQSSQPLCGLMPLGASYFARP